MDNSLIEKDANITTKEAKKSYQILILYMWLIGISSALGTSHSNISDLIISVYNGNELQKYLLSTAPLFSLTFFNFPCNYLIDKLGNKNTVMLSSTLVLIGSFFKLFLSSSIYYVIIGHFISYISFILLANITTKISSTWFQPQNRLFATSLVICSCSISFSFGYLINFFYFQAFNLTPTSIIDSTNEILINNIRNRIQNNLHLFFVISIINLGLSYYYFEDKPEVATSLSYNIERKSFIESFRILINNKNYLKVVFYFGLAETNFDLFTFMLVYIFSSFEDLTNSRIYFIGFFLNFVSGVSIYFFTLYVRNITLKNTLIYSSFGLTLGLLFLYFAILIGNSFIIYFFTFLFGVVYVLYVSPCLELASELVFPVSEEQAIGGLFFAADVIALISSYIIEHLISSGISTDYVILILIFYYILTYFIIKDVEEDLKKSKHEEDNKIEMKEISEAYINFN